MTPRAFLLFCTATGLLASFTGTSGAVTWHLAPDGSGDVPTIQVGLSSASPGDTIELACGTYHEHDLVIQSAVVLRSVTGDPACATIDADQLGRVASCSGIQGALTIEGITFARGRLESSSARGAGLLCQEVSLVARRCVFVDNDASYAGGGLSCRNCRVALTECTFSGNTGENGGGGGLRGYRVSGTISCCVFEGNHGIDGAGIFLDDSSPLIEWSIFLNNDGWFFGGGAFLQNQASPTFDHCAFVGNEAHLGAGIMTAAAAEPTMRNSIVAFNLDGAGIHCDDGVSSPSYLDLSCSDVFGNENGGYSGWLADQTGLNGNIAANPQFCDLPAGVLSLSAGSPCLPEYNTCGVLMGALGQECGAGGVDGGPGPDAVELSLQPNPFSARTTITFELARATRAELSVIAVDGRRVATLVAADLEAGRHLASWEGRDDLGLALPAGTYFVRLASGSGIRTARLALVR